MLLKAFRQILTLFLEEYALLILKLQYCICANACYMLIRAAP
jgi:hypothetical protein